MQTFTVNTLENENDGIDLNNISLREAVEAANTTPGEDLINFEDSLSGGTVDIGGNLNITDELIITGLGKDDLSVGGTLSFLDNTNNLTISGLSAEGFIAQDNSDIQVNLDDIMGEISAVGGNSVSININRADLSGIITEQIDSVTLTVNESTVSGDILFTVNRGYYVDASINNSTIDNGGIGGIYSGFFNLRVNNSVISGNDSSGIYFPTDNYLTSYIYYFDSISNIIVTNSSITSNRGAAIHMSAGDLTVENSNIIGNQGGGVIGSTGSDLNIVNSTIAQNGFGILNGYGDLSLVQSTISGNEGFGVANFSKIFYGGRGYTFAFRASTTISNSTITDNENGVFNGVDIQGSYVSSPATLASQTTVVNSIISGNDDEDVVNDSDGDFSTYYYVIGKFISEGNNIVGTGNGVSDFSQTTDQTNTAPQLNPLVDNGGFTPTHLPQGDSPAIDAGNRESLPSNEPIRFDQRGEGFNRVVGGQLDIGAVEVQSTVEPSVIFGTTRNDELVGTNQNDIIFGSGGRDNLRGLAGNDSLVGNTERDTLIGGTGDDTLVGGRNSDIFVFEPNFGNDTINDFWGNDGDKIDLSGFESLSFEDLVIDFDGIDTSVTSPETIGFGEITFNNFRAQLISGNFIFAEDMS
ncbi:choice-of-anchor Q domain-containing protein [Gloeocapsa sp. PCC 73106]|uniref:choice-of-anchor Q domain-containing protein n=1 Tax=Gloeocapsa sp. PCC 73106 TaxID=102232 RepID=UPI0002AC6F0B|nr:choice-of-anchor Q domain-containing protein [Gloeocapsa sp. PCC 73106]ELR99429.1 hypothetical protein GLO73106DRAFT_00032800 [Gloeocapsa sp. PCC 73106]